MEIFIVVNSRAHSGRSYPLVFYEKPRIPALNVALALWPMAQYLNLLGGGKGRPSLYIDGLVLRPIAAIPVYLFIPLSLPYSSVFVHLSSLVSLSYIHCIKYSICIYFHLFFFLLFS